MGKYRSQIVTADSGLFLPRQAASIEFTAVSISGIDRVMVEIEIGLEFVFIWF